MRITAVLIPSVYQKQAFEKRRFRPSLTETVPLDHENVGENIYLNMINKAKNYVYIFTPYLIIDPEMLVLPFQRRQAGSGRADCKRPGFRIKKMIIS